MSEAFDPRPAASVLAEAWCSGALLTELPVDIRPRTMGNGYDVQDCLIAMLQEQVVGWKLGVGSTKQKYQSGVGRSIAGRVLASHCRSPGSTITLPNRAPATVEFEIAYVLERDILPDEPECDPLEAVAEMRVTFEVVLSRFVDRRTVGWPSYTADNAAFEALVIGPAIDPSDVHSLVQSVVVSANGHEIARSLSGDDATKPAVAFSDLVALARERPIVLPKGSIISTGTVTKPFNIEGVPTEISATFLDTMVSFRTAV